MSDIDRVQEIIFKISNEVRSKGNIEDNLKAILGILLLKWLNDTQKIFHWSIDKEFSWERLKIKPNILKEVLLEAGKSLERRNKILSGIFSEFLFKGLDSLYNDTCSLILNSFDFLDFTKMDSPILEGFVEWYVSNLKIFEGRKYQSFYTPEIIRKLLIQLTEIRTKNSIFDMCSGVGGILVESVKENQNIKVYGKEIDPDAFYLSKINLILNGKTDFEIELGDVLTEPLVDKEGRLKKFDVVTGNFPFSVEVRSKLEALKNDIYGRFNFLDTPSFRGDWFFIQHAIAVTDKTGICALVVSQGSLVNSIDEKIRKKIVEEDIIEAVIDLPPKLFEDISIAVSILVINKNKPAERKNKILMIDASDKYIAANRRTNTLSDEQFNSILTVFRNGEERKAYSRFVDINEIREKEYRLDTKPYVKINEILKEISNPQRLKDVSQIFRGLQIKADEIETLHDDDSPYYLLDVGDIQNGEIDLNLLTRIRIKNQRWLSLYLLKEGDVIVSSRGTTIKVAVVEKDMPKLIISGNLVCIRLNRNLVNPYFLKIYLESETGKALLEAVQTGSSIRVINPKSLENIPIPMVDIATQNEIGELYLKARNQYKEAIEKAEKDFTTAMESIYSKLGFK